MNCALCKKLSKDAHLDLASRKHLVGLGTAEYPWMDVEAIEGMSPDILRKRWPKLTFIRFEILGADNVVRYCEYQGGAEDKRIIVMGRPGSTDEVKSGMASFKIDPDAGYYMLGPELPDVSSSAVRNAFRTLRDSLHPDVSVVSLGNLRCWRVYSFC